MWIRSAPLLALAMFACQAQTLHDIITADEAIAVPPLAGVWMSGDDMISMQLEGAAYSVRVFRSGSPTIRFTARLCRVGDALFLDLVPLVDSRFQLALHFLLRVRVDDDTFTVSLVDLEPLSRGSVVLGDGPEWRRAIRDFAARQPESWGIEAIRAR